MAVVNLKSNLFRDAQAMGDVVDPVLIKGRTVTATGTITNAAADNSGSSYHMCDLPSDCLIDEDTAFDVENWGFAAVRIGTKSDVDALVSVLKSAAATHRPRAFGDANHGKRLWEILGLAANPGGYIGIYAHAIADATGAGSMPFKFVTTQH
jgi:hypothetical protein